MDLWFGSVLRIHRNRVFVTSTYCRLFGKRIDGEKKVADVGKEITKKTGTVLLVWEHSAIPDLSKALGVKHPPVTSIQSGENLNPQA